MRRTAYAPLLAPILLATACVDVEDDALLETSSVSQEVISSELLGRGYGWGGQATGGAGGLHYIVTSTADDGSCGTLRHGLSLADANNGVWITFDPSVFPAGTKKSIWLGSALRVPSNTTIDGRGSYVSLRRAYDASNIWWFKYDSGTYECRNSVDKGPILDIRGARNVIVTNLDFYKTYPLGSVTYDTNLDRDDLPNNGSVNLDGVSSELIDAQCFGDEIAIQFGSTEVWIDHNDFAHCGDECVSIRAPSDVFPFERSDVTISNNLFNGAWKAILMGAPGDMRDGDSIKIAASVYQNRFVGVKYRQPRVEAAVAHVYNNLYEDWHGQAIHAHATTSAKIRAENPGLEVVRTRAMVEHNVFRAVTTTKKATDEIEAADEGHESEVDAVLWKRTSRCSSNVASEDCATSASFPGCNSTWYFPCDPENRANLMSFSSLTYAQAYAQLRYLAGSSRTMANDTYGYAAYSCEPENAPPF